MPSERKSSLFYIQIWHLLFRHLQPQHRGKYFQMYHVPWFGSPENPCKVPSWKLMLEWASSSHHLSWTSEMDQSMHSLPQRIPVRFNQWGVWSRLTYWKEWLTFSPIWGWRGRCSDFPFHSLPVWVLEMSPSTLYLRLLGPYYPVSFFPPLIIL